MTSRRTIAIGWSLFFLAATLQTAHAADPTLITFRAVDEASGSPVGAVVFAKSQTGETPVGDFVPPVPLNKDAGLCATALMTFRAEPADWMSYLPDPRKYPCQAGVITFHFRAYAFPTAITDALSADYAKLAGGDKMIYVLGSQLAVWSQAKAFDKIAVIGTELAARLKGSGQTSLGRSAELLAYVAGSKALAIGEPVIFDPAQNKYVLSEDGVNSIKAFQKQTGIKTTGTLDWNTLNELSGSYAKFLTKRLYR